MEMLDIWPAFFPIVVRSRDEEPEDDGVWNVGSARKHPDRVREIFFDDISSQIFDSEVFSSEIQGSFPVLTTLVLKIGYRRHFLFPEPFCHRSSPRLRSLDLDSIPFSAVHELLLSANGLVDLSLWDLPEYVSPEGIVPYLSLMAGSNQCILASVTLKIFRTKSVNVHIHYQASSSLLSSVLC